MARGKCLIQHRDGQQVIEYMVMATAVAVIFILAVYPRNSPMRSTVNDVLNIPERLIGHKNAQIRF